VTADALPARSPSARFIGGQSDSVITAPSAQDLWRTVSRAQQNPAGLSGILEGIDDLSLSNDDDEYKPKPYAIKNAKDRIKYGYASLNDDIRTRIPAPQIMADGTGGIVIVWNHNGKALNAGFPPNSVRKDYLYYQFGVEYRLIRATLENLKDRLEWLVRE
jgi:hypothetical protein